MQFFIKHILIISCLLFHQEIAKAQTWDEWFNQKRTQKKYTLTQIAKLRLHIGYLKEGYNIIQNGLNLVSTIKEGDFRLHHLYFTRRKKVSSKVKMYAKVSDIISMQLKMFSAYRNSYLQLKQAGEFKYDETNYIFQTIGNLINLAFTNIDNLTTIITDGALDMSDDERLSRVDELWLQMSQIYQDLFSFINRVKILSLQRTHELSDLQTLKNLYEP